MQVNDDNRESRKFENNNNNRKQSKSKTPYGRTRKQQAVYNKATTLLWKNLYEGVKQFSEKSKNLHHLYNTINLQDFIKHLKRLCNEASQLNDDLQMLSELHERAKGKYDN